MVDHYKHGTIESGFLVVLRFDVLYSRYAPRYQGTRDICALPRIDRSWTECPIKYCGTDRDALDANHDRPSLLAELLLADLEMQGRCIGGVLRTPEDLDEVLRSLEDDVAQYEAIWVRQMGADEHVPAGISRLGIEPSYFIGDHFSASCDCMMIPRWHGTDGDGTLFLDHFRRLNQHGLFESEGNAWKFFDYYCSLDWTENDRSDYVMVGVFGASEGRGA